MWLQGCTAGKAGWALAGDEERDSRNWLSGKREVYLLPPLSMDRVRQGLQLDYSLMLRLWQAVFSTPPLYWLDLITGDGLGVDTESVLHLNRRQAEEALLQT